MTEAGGFNPNSSAPKSQVDAASSLSLPSMSTLTPAGLVPKSTPVSIKSVPVFRCKSGSVVDVPIKWSAYAASTVSLVAGEPRPLSTPLYAIVADVPAKSLKTCVPIREKMLFLKLESAFASAVNILPAAPDPPEVPSPCIL